MDRKLETFLTVCRTMNYRAAAEQLNLTQPAITKQIQSLEAEYQIKLFNYDGRRLHKTEKCRLLEAYAQSMEYNYQELQMALRAQERQHLRVGATKTIGDYVICDSVVRYLSEQSHELTLIVDNTEHLLEALDTSQLDFAIVEGIFDKSKYQFKLFRNEPFLCVRAAQEEKSAPDASLHIEDLFWENIIVREKGSGTRELFERDLRSMGYSLDAFSRVIELSSFRLIREAVKAGLGVSFVYASVVKEDEGLDRFFVSGIQAEHEFNIVCLKNTPAMRYADRFLQEANMQFFR